MAYDPSTQLGNEASLEAQINVLADKGVITRDEVMREIKRLQAEIVSVAQFWETY